MTIEQERVIDFLAVSKSSGKKILTISDHLQWSDYEYHSMSLQSKINYYLEYIYSNKIHKILPGGDNNSIRIQLIMKHEPTSRATRLLGEIKAKIEMLGFEFVHGVFDEE